MTATLLMLILSGAPEDFGRRDVVELVALRQANKLVTDTFEQRGSSCPKLPRLGAPPTTSPTGHLKVEFVKRATHIEHTGPGYRVTYSVTIPAGGEGHFRIELLRGNRQWDGSYACAGLSRHGKTLPVGTTDRSYELLFVHEPNTLFVLVARSVKTHKHLILGVVLDPFSEDERAVASEGAATYQAMHKP